jgi:hypothetical protein
VNSIGKRFFWVSAYAIAMALLEAVVVIYLRDLLHVTEESVVLGEYARIEIWREVATLVMLLAIGWMAGRSGLERLAFGLFAFGLWDIWYYVWLRVFIGWPGSLFSWDVLFLIPLRWWGPVIAPVLVAALICVVAVLAVIRLERGERVQFTLSRVAAILMGGLLMLYVFMADALHALLQGQSDWDTLRPEPFKWPLYLLALALMAWPSLRAVWPTLDFSVRKRLGETG